MGSRLRSGVKTLRERNPNLVSEWHPILNGEVTPDDVAAGTNNFAWWKCNQCNHEWSARINSRNRGTGCPKCFGRFDKPLSVTHPELALECFDSRINVNNITAGSAKIVNWKCPKCNYIWPSTISNRKNGQGCPKCAGKIVTNENSLASVRPNLIDQWHPNKNKNITPNDIHAFSDRIVWWKCNKCEYEWKTSPNHRSSGTGCPKCNRRYNVSFNELVVLYALKNVLKNIIILHGYKVNDIEVDILLKQLKVCIEYDGEYSHRNRKEKDEAKTLKLINNGFSVIRIRESGLPSLDVKNTKVKIIDYLWENDKGYLKLKEVVTEILVYLKDIINLNFNIELVNELDIYSDRFKILSQLEPIVKKGNLKEKYPYLEIEFNLEKNSPFSLEHFMPGANFHLWWRCIKCKYEWESVPNARVKGSGCPFCAGQVVHEGNCLETVNPELASEWDYDKNTLTPLVVLPKSNKKFWWKCSKGHSWDASPTHRSRGEGCPYCAGKRVNLENCLANVFPDLSKMWNYEKNEKTPYQITSGSKEMVWWKCESDHEWPAPVYAIKRSRNTKFKGCKKCYENSRRKK